MLGSGQSVAGPNTVLNTAVAEVLSQFYDELKDTPADQMESAVHEWIKKTVKAHKRIIFNGNGYDDTWIREATEKRGLLNLRTTPDAIPELLKAKTIEMLTAQKVYTEAELRKMFVGRGGLVAYAGSTDMRDLLKMAETDAKVAEVIDAFHYQIGKEIGAMAAAMHGQVDQIILTGGIAYGKETVHALKDMVEWIAPVTVYPGEDELLALAQAALRVLNGEEQAKEY